jgi:cytochrome c
MTMSGKKKVSALAAFAVVGATGLWGAGVTAQIIDGPFTAAQADAGRAAYVTNCMACHQANMAGEGDALPLVGKTFMAAWGNRTTKELYETIHTSMPYGNGGSLDAKTYTDLTAFILQSNGSKQHGGQAEHDRNRHSICGGFARSEGFCTHTVRRA